MLFLFKNSFFARRPIGPLVERHRHIRSPSHAKVRWVSSFIFIMRPGPLLRLAGAVALMLAMPVRAFLALPKARAALGGGALSRAAVCIRKTQGCVGPLLPPSMHPGGGAPHQALCTTTMLAEGTRRTAYPGGRGLLCLCSLIVHITTRVCACVRVCARETVCVCVCV